MTHRPSDEILMAYAAGSLAQGPALVVAAHVSLRPDSAERVRQFEAAGGIALEDAPVADMAANALEQVLARLDASAPLQIMPQVRHLAAIPEDLVLPHPLEQYDIGKWKFLAPGVQWSSIGRGGLPRNRPMLLRAKPGMVMPEHIHRGVEYTLVLKGTLHDALGDYYPGDLVVADASLEHEPKAGPDEECICLAVVDGRLQLKSMLGRLVQPLLGF